MSRPQCWYEDTKESPVFFHGCAVWQVRLVNLVKRAVLPFKNHRGRVKSIAVLDPCKRPDHTGGIAQMQTTVHSVSNKFF